MCELIFPVTSENDSIVNRLLLLKNGVVNYSGGIYNLYEKVCELTEGDDVLISETINDVRYYLRDLIILLEQQGLIDNY